MRQTISVESLKKRIDASQGRIECDLIIKNSKYLDIFNMKWCEGEIAVFDGSIVGLESGLKSRKAIDAKGKWVVPGFIDAHVHVESSMMTPDNFEQAVLPRGTTTAICDPHELANVVGIDGIRYFLDSAEKLNMDLWVMLSSCVPATHLETNGGGIISASQLKGLSNHPRALGLAEMMNFPGVLMTDVNVMEKIADFSSRPIDGHAPLLMGRNLSTYAVAGMTSCHESSNIEEAREKISKGISVWIREGSVAKDFDSLIDILNSETVNSIGFCTDDRNPLDIADEGHIDHLVRKTILKGLAPELVFKAATWSVANHYGLNRGPWRTGAIAPGYQADLILLENLEKLKISEIFKSGTSFRDLVHPKVTESGIKNSVKASIPAAKSLEGPQGRVHVMRAMQGQIITGHEVMDAAADGVCRISVLERYGNNNPPSNGYVIGFGKLRGAIASSVAHDSHNLVVVGDNTNDMRVALSKLIEYGGGFCVVNNGKTLASLELPFGGLMSSASPGMIKESLINLKKSAREIGCTLVEPFLQLAFMSLPVIPFLKITDKGLVDVEKFEIIDVKA